MNRSPHSHFCPRCSQHVHCDAGDDGGCLTPAHIAMTCNPCAARYAATADLLAASRRRLAATCALLLFLATPAFAKGRHCSKKHPRPGCPPAAEVRP